MTGVILAGGPSRRMGTDKAFLTLGGKTLLERQIEAMRRIFPSLLISAHDVERYRGYGLAVVPDAYPLRASLVGIYSALQAAPDPWCFAVACDMPFVESGFILHLEGFARDVDAVVPRQRGNFEPLHAWYSKTCLGCLRRRLDAGEVRIHELFEGPLRTAIVDVEATPWSGRADEIFFNVNTPADLERAERRLGRTGEPAAPSN